MLLVPANYWQAIDPLHTRTALFRAIESGVSLVRATLNGLSIAVDARWETRASCDAFESPGGTMTAPTIRSWTVYAHVGDLSAWLSVVGSLGLVAAARRARAK